MFRFANPYYLLLLIVIPFLFYYYEKYRIKKQAAIRYSTFEIFNEIGTQNNIIYRKILDLSRIFVIILCIVALARPQMGLSSEVINTEGVDIVLSLDISGTMNTEDFKPNRLGLAKEVIKKFIEGRENDRHGLVVFSGQSFTQCPLTLDYNLLLKLLDKVEIGMIDNGTAIGMGIATSINRLRDSNAKSKVIILLTDGRNNTGEIDPVTAANMAKNMGIKIYTIGVGRPEGELFLVNDPIFGKQYVKVPNELDENILQQLADITGGLYFRADSENKLLEIYKQIDSMEKTVIKRKEYKRYNELFRYFIIPAFLILAVEMILGHSIFLKIP